MKYSCGTLQITFYGPPNRHCERLPRLNTTGADVSAQGADVSALVPFCPAQFNVTHSLYLSDYL